MTELRFPGQAPSQVALHFLDLLDDVHRIHGLFLEEITTLRGRIAELEASKTPFVEANGTLGSVPDVPGCAVYLVSQDGTIQSWSGGACELYGYSVEETLGRDPAMLRPQPAPLLPASHRLRKDGRVFAVYLHHAVLPDQTGQACGRMCVEIPLNADGTATGGGGH
jgi:PAS domain-containing protein